MRPVINYLKPKKMLQYFPKAFSVTFLLFVLSSFSITLHAQNIGLKWVDVIGGPEMQYVTDIAVDDIGNVYVTGVFEGTVDFDPGVGVVTLISPTGLYGGAIFIQKLDSLGNLLWVKKVATGHQSRSYSIAVDASYNVYVCGVFGGNVDFDPGSSNVILTSTFVPFPDGFVLKLNSQGNFGWVNQIGSTGSNICESVCFDYANNLYVSGTFTYTVDFDPGSGVVSRFANGGADVFIQKLDTAGNLIHVSTFGGFSSLDHGETTTDAVGNVYTTGSFQSIVDFNPTTGSYSMTPNGDKDIFVQKLDPNGNFLWAKQMGGTMTDLGTGIVVDPMGDVIVTGLFRSTVDFDPGAGVSNLTAPIGTDNFIQKLTSNGNFIWALRNSEAGSWPYDQKVDVDILGDIYLSQSFSYTSDFDPGVGTYNLSPYGNMDMYIQKLDNNGNFVWANHLGGNSGLYCYSLEVDDIGYIYIAGAFTDSVDFDPSIEEVNKVAAGTSKMYVLKLNQCESDSVIDVITACDSLTWVDGITYYADNNTASFTLVNATGCDSLVTLDLTVVLNASNTAIDNIIACDSYTWIDGITYNSSNTSAQYTLTNSAGCDSVITLDLILNNTVRTTDVQDACYSYTWVDGITYTTSNSTASYNFAGASSNGCDSIVTLNLSINATLTEDTITACDSYTWIDGVTYSSSNNTAVASFTNVLGCDSIIELNLVINSSNHLTEQVTECDSYTWLNGNTYVANDTNAFIMFTNTAGCDSLVELDLTINYSDIITAEVTACNNYTWINGITYLTSNNSDKLTFTNNVGCDSVIALDLIVNTVDVDLEKNNSTLSVSDVSDSYQWINCDSNSIIEGEISSNFTAIQNGSYAIQVTSNGCTDTSNCYTYFDLDPCTGIKVYPNPTTSEVTVDLGGQKSVEAKIFVVDYLGKNIFEVENGNAVLQRKKKLDFSHWAKSTYFVKVIIDERICVYQVTKL